MADRVELKFSCDQDFNAMSSTERGRFCDSCQKEVIDFTNYRIQDVNALTESGAEICGVFRADQLDPSLHPIKIPQQVKSFAFLSSLFIWLGVSNVNAQSTVDPKIVQSEGASNAPQLTPQETEEQLQSGTPISMSTGNSVITASDEISPEDHSKMDRKADRQSKRNVKKMRRRYGKKWFWSKRFPFAHRRRHHGGAVCKPSF